MVTNIKFYSKKIVYDSTNVLSELRNFDKFNTDPINNTTGDNPEIVFKHEDKKRLSVIFEDRIVTSENNTNDNYPQKIFLQANDNGKTCILYFHDNDAPDVTKLQLIRMGTYPSNMIAFAKNDNPGKLCLLATKNEDKSEYHNSYELEKQTEYFDGKPTYSYFLTQKIVDDLNDIGDDAPVIKLVSKNESMPGNDYFVPVFENSANPETYFMNTEFNYVRSLSTIKHQPPSTIPENINNGSNGTENSPFHILVDETQKKHHSSNPNSLKSKQFIIKETSMGKVTISNYYDGLDESIEGGSLKGVVEEIYHKSLSNTNESWVRDDTNSSYLNVTKNGNDYNITFKEYETLLNKYVKISLTFIHNNNTQIDRKVEIYVKIVGVELSVNNSLFSPQSLSLKYVENDEDHSYDAIILQSDAKEQDVLKNDTNNSISFTKLKYNHSGSFSAKFYDKDGATISNGEQKEIIISGEDGDATYNVDMAELTADNAFKLLKAQSGKITITTEVTSGNIIYNEKTWDIDTNNTIYTVINKPNVSEETHIATLYKKLVIKAEDDSVNAYVQEITNDNCNVDLETKRKIIYSYGHPLLTSFEIISIYTLITDDGLKNTAKTQKYEHPSTELTLTAAKKTVTIAAKVQDIDNVKYRWNHLERMSYKQSYGSGGTTTTSYFTNLPRYELLLLDVEDLKRDCGEFFIPTFKEDNPQSITLSSTEKDIKQSLSKLAGKNFFRFVENTENNITFPVQDGEAKLTANYVTLTDIKFTGNTGFVGSLPYKENPQLKFKVQIIRVESDKTERDFKQLPNYSQISLKEVTVNTVPILSLSSASSVTLNEKTINLVGADKQLTGSSTEITKTLVMAKVKGGNLSDLNIKLPTIQFNNTTGDYNITLALAYVNKLEIEGRLQKPISSNTNNDRHFAITFTSSGVNSEYLGKELPIKVTYDNNYDKTFKIRPSKYISYTDNTDQNSALATTWNYTEDPTNSGIYIGSTEKLLHRTHDLDNNISTEKIHIDASSLSTTTDRDEELVEYSLSDFSLYTINQDISTAIVENKLKVTQSFHNNTYKLTLYTEGVPQPLKNAKVKTTDKFMYSIENKLSENIKILVNGDENKLELSHKIDCHIFTPIIANNAPKLYKNNETNTSSYSSNKVYKEAWDQNNTNTAKFDSVVDTLGNDNTKLYAFDKSSPKFSFHAFAGSTEEQDVDDITTLGKRSYTIKAETGDAGVLNSNDIMEIKHGYITIVNDKLYGYHMKDIQLQFHSVPKIKANESFTWGVPDDLSKLSDRQKSDREGFYPSNSTTGSGYKVDDLIKGDATVDNLSTTNIVVNPADDANDDLIIANKTFEISTDFKTQLLNGFGKHESTVVDDKTTANARLKYLKFVNVKMNLHTQITNNSPTITKVLSSNSLSVDTDENLDNKSDSKIFGKIVGDTASSFSYSTIVNKKGENDEVVEVSPSPETSHKDESNKLTNIVVLNNDYTLNVKCDVKITKYASETINNMWKNTKIHSYPYLKMNETENGTDADVVYEKLDDIVYKLGDKAVTPYDTHPEKLKNIAQNIGNCLYKLAIDVDDDVGGDGDGEFSNGENKHPTLTVDDLLVIRKNEKETYIVLPTSPTLSDTTSHDFSSQITENTTGATSISTTLKDFLNGISIHEGFVFTDLSGSDFTKYTSLIAGDNVTIVNNNNDKSISELGKRKVSVTITDKSDNTNSPSISMKLNVSNNTFTLDSINGLVNGNKYELQITVAKASNGLGNEKDSKFKINWQHDFKMPDVENSTLFKVNTNYYTEENNPLNMVKSSIADVNNKIKHYNNDKVILLPTNTHESSSKDDVFINKFSGLYSKGTDYIMWHNDFKTFLNNNVKNSSLDSFAAPSSTLIKPVLAEDKKDDIDPPTSVAYYTTEKDTDGDDVSIIKIGSKVLKEAFHSTNNNESYGQLQTFGGVSVIMLYHVYVSPGNGQILVAKYAISTYNRIASISAVVDSQKHSDNYSIKNSYQHGTFLNNDNMSTELQFSFRTDSGAVPTEFEWFWLYRDTYKSGNNVATGWNVYSPSLSRDSETQYNELLWSEGTNPVKIDGDLIRLEDDESAKSDYLKNLTENINVSLFRGVLDRAVYEQGSYIDNDVTKHDLMEQYTHFSTHMPINGYSNYVREFVCCVRTFVTDLPSLPFDVSPVFKVAATPALHLTNNARSVWVDGKKITYYQRVFKKYDEGVESSSFVYSETDKLFYTINMS